MNFREEKFVRFQDWNSEKSSEGKYSTYESGILSRTVSSAVNMFQNGMERGSDRIKNLKRSLGSFSVKSVGFKCLTNSKKILDPQGAFLQRWNKIFVLSCMLAISLDPLFFYIPVVDDDKKCLSLDKRLETAASVLRSFTDIFYIIHIIFQFHTGFIAPPSSVLRRGVLVDNSWEIAKRYLSSYFIIDILAALSLPQVVILIIIPKMGGSRSLNTKNLLKFVVFFQYLPRVIRVYPLYK